VCSASRRPTTRVAVRAPRAARARLRAETSSRRRLGCPICRSPAAPLGANDEDGPADGVCV
jgi:hypothetical protein